MESIYLGEISQRCMWFSSIGPIEARFLYRSVVFLSTFMKRANNGFSSCFSFDFVGWRKLHGVAWPETNYQRYRGKLFLIFDYSVEC